MLKKVFIALFIALLCTGNSGITQLGRFSMALMCKWDNRFANSLAKTLPLNDAEEQSGKDAPESSESEDDEYVSFKWSSLRLSGNSEVSQQRASLLFENIDREILVPPPRV